MAIALQTYLAGSAAAAERALNLSAQPLGGLCSLPNVRWSQDAYLVAQTPQINGVVMVLYRPNQHVGPGVYRRPAELKDADFLATSWEESVVDDRDYHAAVGEAINVLVGGLTPFVQRVMSASLPPGVAWPELLRRKDAAGGRPGSR
jgi:hypothetical protein